MEDRRSIVTHVVNSYAKESGNTAAPILDELIDFILEDVLESDALWDEHIKDEEWFALPVVDFILTRCIQRVDREKSLSKLSQEELHSIGLPIFLAVIRDRWNCPVPFILC
ncbi:hypothetical protein [Streptomyces violascens]|uniref:hypothetical protein n=1 Tax=Streptomyces violascens TaxID=67381 RepID=UPI003659AF41